MADGLPESVTAYKKTPVFDQDTIPTGLRRGHSTKPGVWALIHVIEGHLRYRIYAPPSEEILSVGRPGLVRPEQQHEVEPIGPVRFFVEFHAAEAPEGGPHSGG